MESSADRSVSPHVAQSLLRYVETVLGEEGLAEVVDLVPGDLDVDAMRRSERWWTRREILRIADWVGRRTHDPTIGRRAGEQSFRDIIGGPAGDAIVGLGSVESACIAVADYSSKMAGDRLVRVVESSSSHAIFEGEFLGATPPDRFTCDYAAGYFGDLPRAFGQLGRMVETECQVEGAPRCRYRLVWEPDPTVSEAEIAQRRLRSAGALDRLETYHEVASRLVGADDVNELLDLIVAYVSQSLQAPRYALSARLPGDEVPRVHAVGFPTEEVDAILEAIAAGRPLAPELVAVPVESSRRVYGELIAGFHPGSTRSDYDRRVLRAYASYAASALEVVAALESARRDRDLAESLLSLGRALGELGDREWVSAQLARALPEALSCDLAGIWLVEDDGETLRLATACDHRGRSIVVPEHRIPVELLDEWWPVDGPAAFVHRGDDPPAAMAEMLDAGGLAESALVRFSAGGALVGVATGGFVDSPADARREIIVERLTGLTDQARVAFENARLVEQMRHQALHDDLTGLPNRHLLEDRATSALRRRTRTGEDVALAFVDVDAFKEVNDTLGHHAGDELLCQIAERLAASVRGVDTCARFGGDEFVVLLADPASPRAAEEVVERMVAALEPPFIIDGEMRKVTASVGLTWAGDESRSFEQLLQRADEAMYRAKSSAGRTIVTLD